MVLCERSNSRYSIQTKKMKLVYHILEDDLLFVSRQETSLASSSRNDCDVYGHARMHRPQCIFDKRQVFREQREIVIQVVIIRQCVTRLARSSIVRLPKSLSVLQETCRSPFTVIYRIWMSATAKYYPQLIAYRLQIEALCIVGYGVFFCNPIKNVRQAGAGRKGRRKSKNEIRSKLDERRIERRAFRIHEDAKRTLYH